MPKVDWLALWNEFAQATDNEQLEVAERIVYLFILTADGIFPN
jgi:hypothetical protein